MSFVSPELMCIVLVTLTACALLLGFPVAFTLAGVSMFVAVLGSVLGVFDEALLIAFPQRVFSIMTNETLIAVPLFIFMGVMLERSKLAEELLINMARVFGGRSGGIAYAVCIVGAILAASTGIAGATVVTIGLLSLPIMLQRGYSASLSCGVITASGTLGQIIPPSIILVLLGDQLSVAYQNAQFSQGIFAPDTVSVNELFAGALFPGLMLVGLYMSFIFVRTLINPSVAPPLDEDNPWAEPGFMRSFIVSLVAPILMIVAVLGSILTGIASPTEAAAVGAAGAMLLAGYKLNPSAQKLISVGVVSFGVMLIIADNFDMRTQKETIAFIDWIAIGVAGIAAIAFTAAMAFALFTTFRAYTNKGTSVLGEVMGTTMRMSSMVFVILIGATMFSLAFRGFGGEDYIKEWLQSLPGGTVAAVIVVMIFMFLLGFFLDYLEIVFIVVPIVAPILLQMEIAPGVAMSPVWLGVLMSVNLQTSYLTPPFGYALFFLRGVAPKEVTTPQIYKGVIPFILLQLTALVILWLFPQIATWLPDAIYGT